MDCKIIAIDMDGTLLNSRQKISTTNKTAITKALDKGIKVVLCSGRSYDGLSDSAKELGIKGPDQYLIEFGGSVIENLEQRVFYKEVLKNEECRFIADYLVEQKINFHLIDNQGTLYDGYQDWVEKHMLDTNLGIVKILVHTRKHKLDALYDQLNQKYGQDYYLVKTSSEDFELFPLYVNKGTALEQLAKHLKINMKQVLAIGDYYNDLPMLKLAGKSVAVNNSVAAVKDISDEVVADNNHDGVSEAIEKFAL